MLTRSATDSLICIGYPEKGLSDCGMENWEARRVSFIRQRNGSGKRGRDVLRDQGQRLWEDLFESFSRWKEELLNQEW